MPDPLSLAPGASRARAASPPSFQSSSEPPEARRARLREAAVALEASFLAEMLRHGGAGRGTPGFDGGAGEAAFSGQLVAEQARGLAESGGIGLAERLFEALAAREGLDER